jgi:LmbE family N-acetylglucosaminyl deacetylase
MKVLVVSPHMDDEVLGVGGTIAKHVENGDEVYVCFIAHRIYNHKYDKVASDREMDNALKAKKVLEYKEAKFLNLNDERLDLCIQDILIPLENYISEINPELIYVNHGGDNHQDHKAVFKAVMVAIRPSAAKGIKKVLVYESPSSTEQSPPIPEYAFLPNFYVNIEKFINKKIQALKCYERESRKFPHPRSLEGIEILAKKRGLEIGFPTSEAFVVLREKWE